MTKYNQQFQSSGTRNQLGAEPSLDSSKRQNKAEEICGTCKEFECTLQGEKSNKKLRVPANGSPVIAITNGTT